MALQPTLPPSNPPHEREQGFRPLSTGDSPGAAASNALAQISAAQLLPRGIHSLYAQHPGALLGSGQAAGMALSSHTHPKLSSGLNSSSGPTAMGAARYLAGLGMTTVLLMLAVILTHMPLHTCMAMLLPVPCNCLHAVMAVH